ncbi:hypothetical protein FRC12_020518 [Ceratobasidium sp. 428]|nr:hypothetical protein FRC12_020518 [Ceratobasidium sp. 428]
MDNDLNSSHPTWGAPFHKSVSEWYARQLTRKNPTSQQISQDLDTLRVGSPTCAVFERILFIPERPGYLRHFLNGGLAPRCMLLLRAYCESNNIFDYAYGILCLRTLLLVLEVGLMETINPNILNETNKLMINHEHFTGQLGSTMRQLILVSKPSRSGQKNYLQGLGWSRTSDEKNGLTCLPVVGGLTWPDVKFLVDQTVDDLQRIITLSSTNMFGFATLLFITWQYFIVTEAEARLCIGLQNLIFRYWPAALRGETGILHYMSDWLDARISRYTKNPGLISADWLDQRQVINTYAHCISEDPLAPLADTARLTEFLALTEDLGVEVASMIGDLVQHAFNRCWSHLEDVKSNPESWQYVTRVCGASLEMIKPAVIVEETLSELLPAFGARLNLIELLGHLLVIGLKPESHRPTNQGKFFHPFVSFPEVAL